MLKDKSGNRLYRKVTVRMVFPDDANGKAIFSPRTFTKHAGPHQGFNADNIDEILMQVADRLEQLYPWWEFKSNELSPVGRTARYSFSFAGYNMNYKPATPETQLTDSNTLEPDAVAGIPQPANSASNVEDAGNTPKDAAASEASAQ